MEKVYNNKLEMSNSKKSQASDDQEEPEIIREIVEEIVEDAKETPKKREKPEPQKMQGPPS